MNVTIVGAGVIGYAVGCELASRGAEVRIIDPRGAGGGATRASAGILAPYIEGHAERLLRLTVCSLGQYDAFVDRVSAAAGQPIEYRRTGTLEVARDEADAERLALAAGRLAAAGVPHTYLDGDAARRLEPALTATAARALLVPQHGYVGVATLMSALAAAASRHGVALVVAPTQRIEPAGDRVHVVTPAGRFASDAVVVAAGSWAGQLSMAPALPPPVRPIRGQLLHLRFAEAPVSRVIWSAGVYAVPWQDGSLLVGATSEDVGFDESATAGGVRDLLERAAAVLPVTRTGRFEGVRVGLRPATADELPVIGPSSTMRSVYYATGHYRNGVLLAPLTAAMLSDLILDGRERPELALVRPDRFGL